MRKFVGEATPIEARGFILARNLFAHLLNSPNGSEISPDPTKEMLVEGFSAEMGPAQCCCWFLQGDFPVFPEEKTGQKSGTCGTAFT